MQIVLKLLSGACRRMEGCAKNPIFDLLIVDHDSGFWKKGDEAIFDAKLDSRATTIIRASSTPEVEFCTICFELSNVRNHTRHRNSLRTDRSNKRVIDIDVNNHGHYVIADVGCVGEANVKFRVGG